MDEIELRKTLVECIPDAIFKRNGQILYSGIDTVCPGEFYIVGLNPAKDGTNPRLCDVPLNRQHWSAYTQQCWRHSNCGASCADVGRAPHQKRVQKIMFELGITPERTFAANLVFVESRSSEDIKREIKDGGLFDIFWRVHAKLLSEIRAKCILCLGNQADLSAFSLVRKKAAAIGYERKTEKFKSFVGAFHLPDGLTLRTKVIGVHHPSYPMNPEGLRDWMSQP